MADLGNQKIKDTYQLVLQADASGNLQKLDGTSPSLTINSAFTYNVGTLVDGYVLKSNGSGVASWGALNADIYLSAATLNGTTLELDTTSGNTLSVDLSSLAGDSYWSANTDGSISPSGLTTSVGIGTTTPNSTLTVVGGVSATTFLSTNVINATTIQGSEFNSTSDTGYKINTNKSLWVDGSDTQVGNTSLGTDILGTSINLQTATTVVGNISGTTNLYIDDNMYSGTTNLLDIFASSAITNQDVYWSANTLGISNSGLTGNVGIGTSTPNKKLTVVGDISGTTDLYLGSSTHTASTITAENKLTIKGHSSTNDYLTLENDYIHMFIDGTSAFVVQNTPGDGMIVLNASSKNMDTKIVTDDGTNAVHVDAGLNLVRIREKALIGPGTPTDYSQSLYVSGSSLFYSGGTSLTNTKAISAVGHISGTTDLYIDNKVGIGTSNPNKTLTVVGDISANTINFSLIDGGTF